MTTAVANPEELPLGRFVAYSLVLHAALAATIAASIFFKFKGDQWSGLGGDPGQSINVTMVPSAGIPMPQPPAIPDATAFDPTNGLYKEVPQPKPPAPPPDAIPLPSPEKEKPKQPPKPSKVFEPKTPPPDNALKYGKSGRPPIPMGNNSTPGVSAPSGVPMAGQGGGDFATRFGWYIQAAKRRVDPNWDRLSIDPGVRNSTTLHAAVSFVINRDGSIKNVRITTSSGNLSWDNAGLRAIMGSNPLPPLPSEFQGSEVSVTWDFPEQHR
jgi:periplasmic protein TonB